MKSSLLLLAGFLFISVLHAQTPGSVSSYQKISSIAGSFGGILQNGNYFGWAVENIGDINSDGINDIAISAPYKSINGTPGSGAIFICRLNPNGTVKATTEISSASGNLNETFSANTYFGVAIANIGDLNGDGINDIAVSTGASSNPKIFILRLDTNGTVKQKNSWNGPIGGYGCDIAGLGLFDNDQVPDLAIGSYIENKVYVICLNANGTVKTTSNFSISSGGFGGSLCNMGDIDNDGIKDLVVGAYSEDSNTGAVMCAG